MDVIFLFNKFFLIICFERKDWLDLEIIKQFFGGSFLGMILNFFFYIVIYNYFNMYFIIGFVVGFLVFVFFKIFVFLVGIGMFII